MSAYLNGQKVEHNVLSTHFESYNKECVTIKETWDICLLGQETQPMRFNMLLN